MPEPLRGGCTCGAVRFALDDLFDAGYCHCSICRRMSGAPLVFWANAPASAFHLTAGEPRAFASSEHYVRYFCARCGAPVYGRQAEPPADDTDRVSIFVPSLDRPEAVRPTVHMWCGSGQPGFDTRDDLPRFAEGELSHPRERRSWRAE